MENKVEIRIATMNDIEQICQLYTEFFAYNAKLQPKYCKEIKENGNYPKSIITDDKSDIIIAIENNTILGFVHIQEAETPPYDSVVQHKFAVIIDFIVTVLCREKGIGKKLMDEAKKWTKLRNLEYIELMVLNNAKEANSFYEKNGFVTVSHTMRYGL